MNTDDKIAKFRNEHMAAAGAHFDHWLKSVAESPIEQLLLACMFANDWGPNEHPFSNHYHLHKEVSEMGLKPTPWILAADGAACFCVLQLPVTFGPLSYRADFAFLGTSAPGDAPVRICVELDGHDFHERTKEQASRDKRRDRAFAANGWTMLRFTGSDVFRDPEAVLDEVIRVGNKMCWPWMEEQEP